MTGSGTSDHSVIAHCEGQAGTAQAHALRLPKGCVVEAKVVAQEAVVDAEQGFVLIEIARRAATGREQNHAGRQECSRIMSKQVLALPAQ